MVNTFAHKVADMEDHQENSVFSPPTRPNTGVVHPVPPHTLSPHPDDITETLVTRTTLRTTQVATRTPITPEENDVIEDTETACRCLFDSKNDASLTMSIAALVRIGRRSSC